MVPSVNVRRFGGLVALLTVLSSGYFTVSSLTDPGGLVPGGDQAASRTYAAYMAARSIVLLGGLVWLLAVRAWRSLGLLLALNGAVQIADAVIGALHQQVPQTVGPLMFAAALLTAARLLEVRTRPLGRLRPASG